MVGEGSVSLLNSSSNYIYFKRYGIGGTYGGNGGRTYLMENWINDEDFLFVIYNNTLYGNSIPANNDTNTIGWENVPTNMQGTGEVGFERCSSTGHYGFGGGGGGFEGKGGNGLCGGGGGYCSNGGSSNSYSNIINPYNISGGGGGGGYYGKGEIMEPMEDILRLQMAKLDLVAVAL